MKLNRIILLLTAITLAAIISSGLLFYFNRYKNAVAETHLTAEMNVKKISEKLDAVIEEHQKTIRAIAGIWEVKKAVRDTEKDLLEFANETLKHFQISLGAEVIYLMDDAGTVRASSNHDQPGSFVGKNYAFRPYFKDAIKDGVGAYPALGVTTNKRGLYVSCSVYPDENGVIGGVLVIKESPDHFLEVLNADSAGLYFLASPEGLIFMSSFDKYNSTTLWPLDKVAEEQILSSRQFGKGPWKWSGFSFEPGKSGQHKVHDLAGADFMIHMSPVKLLPGWNIYYLHDIESLFAGSEKAILKTVGLVVLFFCLLFTIISGFLYRFAAKEIKRRLETENLLKANEERLRSFFQTAGSIILVISPEHTVLEMNRAAEDFYGVSREEMVGKNYLGFLPEESRKPVADDIANFLSGRQTEDFENPVLAKDGRERIVLWNVNRLGNATDGVVGIIAIGQDITERKIAETELDSKNRELDLVFKQVEKAKKEWEMTMDCVSDMVFLADENDTIIRLNKSFQLATSKPYGKILRRNWRELLEECSLLPAIFSSEGVSDAYQDNSGRWLIARKHGFRNEQQQKDYTVVSISDISPLMEINEELEKRNDEISENREKLEKALDELSRIIMTVSEEKDFKIRFRTPDFPSCNEVLGCTKVECSCYGDDGEYCWMVSGTLCECGGDEVDESGVKKNCLACEVYRIASADPICRIGEEFNHMMGILEDKNNEVQEAYQELKQAQSQILQQEKMASVGQLAAGVAHEINNPMGFIGSNLSSLGKYSEKLTEFIELQSDMLKKVNDPEILEKLTAARKKLKLDFIVEDMKDLIAESLDGADRVKKIVMGLKNFSRVDQAEQQMASMNDCVESTLNVVWNELKYKCTVEKDYGDIPQIMCFPQQLNQVFMNMLVNGAQAIEDQGVISIKTREEDGFVLVSVTDTGCGIPPENQKRIFEPFFTTKDVGKGTGLGMSIAYDIIHKHGGDILIDSEVGKGSTFTVKLPIKKDEEKRASEG